MESSSTVCAAAISNFVELLIQAGAYEKDIERVLGVELKQLTDPDQRVAMSRLVNLEHEAPRFTKNPAIALQIGQICPKDRSQSGIVGYIASHSSTIGEGFRQAIRYSNLLSDGIFMALEEEQDTAEFIYVRKDPTHFSIQSIEIALVNTVTTLRELCGNEFQLIEASFQYPAPEYLNLYNDVLQSNLNFNQAENKLIFASGVLKRPTPQAQPYINNILIARAAELLSSIENSSKFSKTVQEKIIEGLPWGPLGADKVASSLNISRQTLYRRLKEEGASFQGLLDQSRKELAIKYLGNKSYSITDVAFLLGFSESSSFNRAFRRWYGNSPKSFQRI